LGIIFSELLISAPFWKKKLLTLCHPSAKQMRDDLDTQSPLGIGKATEHFWKGFKHSNGEGKSVIDFLIRTKKLHPQKIVIIQVGEFYETWGIDSIFLVEHCGLNRMGKGGPRAGAPLANIQMLLQHLTKAGFSVAICEQAGDVDKSGRKTRFLSEIVTPSSPVYTYGLAMDRSRSDANFPDCPPEFGIMHSKTGFTLVEIYPDVRTILLSSHLTAEAAHVRLKRYGHRLSRLFVHEHTPKKFLKYSSVPSENHVMIQGYSAIQFPKRMEEIIKIDLSLPSHTEFFQAERECSEDVPQPLYQGTAEQVGVLPLRGIPDIIEYALPQNSPATCKQLLRDYLLQPPPENIAHDLRKTLHALFTKSIALPDFPVTNPARYIKTLHQHEASPSILQDLYHISQNFLACYQTQFLSSLPRILNVVSYLSHIPVHAEILQEKSHIITHILKPIIPTDLDDPYVPQYEGVSLHLFENIEEAFRGRIARTSTADISRLYIQVREAAKTYEEILMKELGMLMNASRKLSYDIHNKVIWLRGNISPEEQKQYALIHPLDRYNKVVRDRWTTENVEQAFLHYRNTVAQTTEEVANILQDVAKKLTVHSVSIVHLTTFSNIMRTLILHAQSGKSRGWNLHVEKTSLQSPFSLAEAKEKNTSGQSSLPQELSIYNGFPYWMSGNTATRNNINIKGMSLLTGHNMAGKSTMLRSVGAISLLATCGLLFPAQEITWSRPIDRWFIRTGNQDDPQAGLSAFAVEVTEINTALHDATQNSLVLIDELGKGTESKAGHAIAASVLEHLRDAKIRGIFATHWHEIFKNSLIDLKDIETWQMEIIENRPTYRLKSGRCLTSWAFEAAKKLGMKASVLRRARIIADAQENHFFRMSSSVLSTQRPVGHTLEEVKNLLVAVANTLEKDIYSISKNTPPPPITAGKSTVYILQTPQDFFYVGETDHLPSRWKDHSQQMTKKDSRGIYIIIPQGKSHARRLENKLINILCTLEFPMLSVSDAHKKHFGGQ
jgi:hypothetical protein